MTTDAAEKIIVAAKSAGILLERDMDRLNRLQPYPEAQARRKEIEQDEQIAKVESLRARWNAPLRQLSKTDLDRGGEWGKAETALLDKITTGFLVALIGTRGSGKTQLAVELMRAATNRLRSSY